MAIAPLSSEIASLVHHVELNKSGWWDKGVQRFILAAIWLAGRTLDFDTLVAELRQRFYLRTELGRIKQQTDALCMDGSLVLLPNGTYKISEHSQKELEATIHEAESTLATAKNKFAGLFCVACPTADVEEAWKSFNEDFLMPLVQEVGARTYELISGSKLHLDRMVRFPEYLQRYNSDSRQAVRNAILSFFDPSDINVRSYILRHMNAYFLIEAGNLGKDTLNSLAKVSASPPSFNIFVDTNFIFSILDLRDNPSNESATSLMQLLTQLPKAVGCKLYVLRPTLDEARGVLGNLRDTLKVIASTPNIADATSTIGLNDIAQKFLEASRKAGRPLNASDYFDPYIDNLIRVLRTKRIELFNQDVEGYRLKQEVIDSLLEQLDFEKNRYGVKGRTYEQLLHDVVLWHFIRDKRPPQVESPLEATYWIVTIDYHFLGFDAFRRRKAAKQVPICVHPTALIQMLQFWLPRTVEFEEAVLGSLRLPFLFQDFDPHAEQVTIRILEALARFENVGDLSKEVVATILLDDILRNKLSFEKNIEKQVEFVKEALIKQTEKIQSQLAEETARVREKLAAAEEEGRKLGSLTLFQKNTISELKTKLEHQERTSAEIERQWKQEAEARSTVEKRVDSLEKLACEKEILNGRYRISAAATLFLVLILLLPEIVRYFLFSSSLNWKAHSALVACELFAWTWVTAAFVKKSNFSSGWHLAQRFLRFKKGLFAMFVTIILGAVGNAVWEYIKGVSGGH